MKYIFNVMCFTAFTISKEYLLYIIVNNYKDKMAKN